MLEFGKALESINQYKRFENQSDVYIKSTLECGHFSTIMPLLENQPKENKLDKDLFTKNKNNQALKNENSLSAPK